MDLGLTGKIAFVAGASRGIGRAVSLELAREGCSVVLVGRTEPDLLDAQAQVQALGMEALAVAADLSTAVGVQRAFAAVSQRFGGLDILVTVGATTVRGTIDELDDEGWQQALDTGVLSVARCARAAVPLMRARGGGRIVVIAATSIHHQHKQLIAYTASKSAAASVAKNLARTLAPDNILVNTICPGIILTEALASRMPAVPGESEAEMVARVMDRIANLDGQGRGLHPDLGRPGKPVEIAAAVAFLASARASYITGATLPVDGGTDF